MKICTHSEKLIDRAKKVSPGGVHSPVRSFRSVGGTPIFIEKAKGVELFDVDGNRYLDFCLAWGPLLFGHADEETLQVIESASRDGWSFGTAEPYSLELAELITKEIPWVEKIRFVNSGTEAVMSALRVARAATGRNKILKFNGCYHGHVDSMLVKAGSGLADAASSDSEGVSEKVASETIVVDLNSEHQVEEIFKIHGDTIAAVIIEPLPANNGLLIQRESFLKFLRKITTQYGALLIFDEVISGFRVAFGGMAEITEIKPDLVTYGKILGGGFPVGAYGGSKKLMAHVAPEGGVYQAGTLSANPVAMRVGFCTLKKILREKPYEKLAKMSQYLKNELESDFIKVQNFGSLFWFIKTSRVNVDIQSLNKIPSTQKEDFSKLFHFLLDRGIYLAPSGFEVGFLSTAHTLQDIDDLVDQIKKFLAN